VLGGERPIGNTPDFSITTSSNTLKHYSSARGMRVQDREVPVQTDYEAAVYDRRRQREEPGRAVPRQRVGSRDHVGHRSQRDVLRHRNRSQLSARHVGGNPTGLRNVANVVVHKTTSGGTLAVINTDYTVDLALGRVIPVAGGLFSDGDAMYVTYDRTAGTQDRVAFGSTVVRARCA
jgi:hypothetical protein